MKQLIDGLILLAITRLLWWAISLASVDAIRLIAFAAILLLAIAVVALEVRR